MKYTKKQIEKSITYWQNIVESFNNKQKSLVNALYNIFGNDLYSNKSILYKQLDIDNVSSSFQELLNFLDGVSAMMAQVKEYEAEAAAEAASWSI